MALPTTSPLPAFSDSDDDYELIDPPVSASSDVLSAQSIDPVSSIPDSLLEDEMVIAKQETEETEPVDIPHLQASLASDEDRAVRCWRRRDQRRKPKNVIKTGVRGTVKFFCLLRGYGFIIREDHDETIFVHRQAIAKRNPTKPIASLGTGEVVLFDVAEDRNGAIEARNVTGPEGTHVQGNPELADQKNLTNRPSAKARKAKRRRLMREAEEAREEVEEKKEEEGVEDGGDVGTQAANEKIEEKGGIESVRGSDEGEKQEDGTTDTKEKEKEGKHIVQNRDEVFDKHKLCLLAIVAIFNIVLTVPCLFILHPLIH